MYSSNNKLRAVTVLLFAASCLSLQVQAGQIKIAESLTGRNGVPYIKWICGPFADNISVVPVKPEQDEIPAGTDLAVVSRTFIKPIIKCEGIKISQKRLTPGAVFEVTYFWRLMTSEPIMEKHSVSVHYKRGSKIYVNHDHNFRTPLKKWIPGELYVDGPYKVKMPLDTPEIDLDIQTAISGTVILPNDTGVIKEGGGYAAPGLVIASIKTGVLTENDDNSPFTSYLQFPEQTVKPYKSLKDKLQSYLAIGGTVLFYGEPMAELHDLMPVTTKPINSSNISSRLIPGDYSGDFTSAIPQAYISVETKQDSTVLGYFDGNNPALIKANRANGTTYYWAGGLGRDYQTPALRPYFDQFFVRFICKLSGSNLQTVSSRYKQAHNKLLNKEKKLLNWITEGSSGNTDAATTAKPEYPGLSENNFGRFGWMNRDGMLVGKFSEEGMFLHNGKYYDFSSDYSEGNEEINVSGTWWILKDPEKKYTHDNLPETGWIKHETPLPFERTTGLYNGIVWYRKKFSVPHALENRDLELNIGAIDDHDYTYVNGNFVGCTTLQTINAYVAPRHYKIPKAFINAGSDNTVIIKVIDLRGSGGIVRLPVVINEYSETKVKKQTLQTENVNWLTKRMKKLPLANGHSITYINTLALPGIAVETASKNISISDLSPSYSGWFKDGSFYPAKVNEENILYNAASDGMWSKNVFIGWGNIKNNKDVPFFLIFQHQPETVKIAGKKMEISFTQQCGRIALVLPYGNRTFSPEETTRWNKNLPSNLLKKADFWSKRALNLPVQCHEAFTINRQENLVNIFNRYEYSDVEDDWGIKYIKWAPVPPLAAMDGKSGLLKWPIKGTVDTGCLTSFGDLFLAYNSDKISYTLQLPPLDYFGIVKINKNKALNFLAEEHFVLPNKWQWRYAKEIDGKWKVWGGLTRKRSHLPPQETDCVKMAWHRRAIGGFSAQFVMEEKGRNLLNELHDSYFLTYNFYQPSSIQEWRTEPFSKISYPINTIFAHGLDMYNDVNEFCTAQQYVDYIFAHSSGDWSTIASTWSFARFTARFPRVMHDWLFMTSGCRENGAGAWVDMINTEMAGSIAHSKVAQKIGNDEFADKLLYRAAKQAVATRQRLLFKDYAQKIGAILEDQPLDDQFVTGFSEYGPKVRTVSAQHRIPFFYGTAAYGVSPYLVLLHKKYAYQQSMEFEKSIEKYAPDWRKKLIFSDPWERLYVRTFMGFPTDEIMKDLETAETHLEIPWREARWGNKPETIAMISSRNGTCFLMDWSGYKITEAEEDSDILKIRFSRPSLNSFINNKVIKLFSKTEVKSITLDNNPFILWHQKDGIVTLDLKNISEDTPHILVLNKGNKEINKHLYYNSPKDIAVGDPEL